MAFMALHILLSIIYMFCLGKIVGGSETIQAFGASGFYVFEAFYNIAGERISSPHRIRVRPSRYPGQQCWCYVLYTDEKFS